MAEEKKKAGVDAAESSSSAKKKVTSCTTFTSFKKLGDRKLFTVELREGETTTVSWKRLVKDATKLSNGSNSSGPEANSVPEPIAHPNLESRIAPGQPDDKEMKDDHPHRFSAVIEKIERLYMGKDSSDDEELDDTPDDDQYDTEDSFIDDADLDEYFEVDNSAIKHDGFFVNRGKLERIEPAMIPEQQQKKRRRKDLPKVDDENADDGCKQNKHAKVTKAAVKKGVLQPEKNSLGSSPNVGVSRSENVENLISQNQLNSGTSTKKTAADTKTIDPCLSVKNSNGDASVSLRGPNVSGKPKARVSAIANVSIKSKDGPSNILHQKPHNKSVLQPKFPPAKAISNVDEGQMREKNVIRELPDIKSSMPTIKPLHPPRRDSSSVRPKGSSLEKAIRELEKAVAESRPPATENQEAGTSPNAIKRRLPREVKLNLAKVARVEHAISGRITEELVRRLNSILGHLLQLRSLKRNLKAMVSTGLYVKQEKDRMFQQIKKEVAEMVRNSAPSVELKAGGQETGHDQKGIPKRKFSMDAVVEDKICDLYDLYVDGLDEDTGPQIRKVYAELAELWPKGCMDHHGIKRAVCRAKDRRTALYNMRKDDQEKRRKKIKAEAVTVEAGLVPQPQNIREKTAGDPSGRGLTSAIKPISNPTSVARAPIPSMSDPNTDRPKQEKLKASSTGPRNEVKMPDGTVMKKKVKRKPEHGLDETRFRSEKLPSQPGEERQKSHKQVNVQQQKGSLHPSGLPSFDPPFG